MLKKNQCHPNFFLNKSRVTFKSTTKTKHNSREVFQKIPCPWTLRWTQIGSLVCHPGPCIVWTSPQLPPGIQALVVLHHRYLRQQTGCQHRELPGLLIPQRRPQLSLHVIHTVEAGSLGVLGIDHDDLPVSFSLVNQSESSQHLHLDYFPSRAHLRIKKYHRNVSGKSNISIEMCFVCF